MKLLSLFIALILASGHTLADKKPKELLKDVNVNKAERLEDYNAAFLQDLLYFSSRHRIVKANEKLLEKGGEITITPFPDVEPLTYRMENQGDETPGASYWHVELRKPPEIQKEMDKYGLKIRATISVHSWDLDQEGNAHFSSLNQFKHSPYWTFNEEDEAVLEEPKEGEFAFAGPPPETPEDIAWHKKIKKLNKHALTSVHAIFQDIDGKKYVLKPLKFTPKYSVLYEVNPDKSFVRSFDHSPGEEKQKRSISEERRLREYQAMKASLPDETDKPVKGDL